MRSFFIGAAGSALVLFLDLTVTQFGEGNLPLRVGIAAIAFLIFTSISWILTSRTSGGDEVPEEKKILSDIESGEDTNIDVKEVDATRATKIASDIKSGQNTDIKMNKIKS